MPCTVTREVVICRPPVRPIGRHVMTCWNCQRRRRVVIRFMGVWYGDTATCCACGDSWTSGERYERPFARGWRQKAIRAAREQWATAVPYRAYRREVSAIVRAELDAAREETAR